MEGTSLLSCSSSSSSSSSSYYYHHINKIHSNTFHVSKRCQFITLVPNNPSLTLSTQRNSLRTHSSALTAALDNSSNSTTTTSDESAKAKDMMPKIDKSGRFCSPRAARELALITLYAACLEGSDPLRLFEKRLNARREPGYEFNKETLVEYNHMSFGGPPVFAKTLEEEEEILRNNEEESSTEAEVLSAPPKLVYSKLILRFTRKLLVATVDKWDTHVAAINRVIPPIWQTKPASKILELSILHLAMAEMSVLGTRHQIVINEAVDLAKRFCDGAAPRIINGCLRTFVKELKESDLPQVLKADEKVPAEV